MHKTVKKTDFLLIIYLLLSAVLLLLVVYTQDDPCIAVIEQNGVILREIDLSGLEKAEEITVAGELGEVHLLAEPGAISFVSSGCTGKQCIRTGKLTKPGQAAVCLPEKVSVRLVGKGSGTDAATG